MFHLRKLVNLTVAAVALTAGLAVTSDARANPPARGGRMTSPTEKRVPVYIYTVYKRCPRTGGWIYYGQYFDARDAARARQTLGLHNSNCEARFWRWGRE